MRTSPHINADVLDATKALAKSAHTTSGRLIPHGMRRAIAIGMTHPNAPCAPRHVNQLRAVCGFVPLTSDGKIVTNHMVRTLRDGLGD